MFGVFEVASRGAQFSYQNKNQADIVNRLLSRFQETGWGEIENTEPTKSDPSAQGRVVCKRCLEIPVYL